MCLPITPEIPYTNKKLQLQQTDVNIVYCQRTKYVLQDPSRLVEFGLYLFQMV